MDLKKTLPVLVASLLAVGCASASRPEAAPSPLATSTSPPASTGPGGESTAPGSPALATTKPTPPVIPATPTQQPASAAGDCSAARLTVRESDSQGTAGSEHADFLITSNGPGQCSLKGWPVLTPTDPNGKTIPVTLTRTGSSTVTQISPGRAARFSAKVSLVDCNTSPLMAPYLKVTLPGQSASERVALSGLAICPHGDLEVTAVTA